MKIAKVTLVWSILGISGSSAQVVKPATRPVLGAVIERFELKEATLLEGVSRLSMEPITGLHVGLEEVLRARLQDPRDRSVQFSVNLSHKTVKDVVEALCRLDRRYTWSMDGESINVYPRSIVGDGGYLLNIKLDAIAVSRIADPQHGLTPLARLLPDQPIGYAQIGGDSDYAETWTASFDHLTVRQFINGLAEHMGPRTAWIWQGGKDSRAFAFFKNGFRPI